MSDEGRAEDSLWRNTSFRRFFAARTLYAGVIVLLIVALTKDVLRLSGFEIGLVLGGAGVGGLLASALIAPRLGSRRWGPLLGLLLLSMGAASAALAISRNVSTAFLATVALDGAAALAFVTAGSVRQAVTPDAVQARVTAAMCLLNRLVRAGGVLLVGWLIVHVGHRQTVMLFAATLAVAGSGVLLSPHSRVRVREVRPL